MRAPALHSALAAVNWSSVFYVYTLMPRLHHAITRLVRDDRDDQTAKGFPLHEHRFKTSRECDSLQLSVYIYREETQEMHLRNKAVGFIRPECTLT